MEPPLLTQQLELTRCPHCGVSSPNLDKRHLIITESQTGQGRRWWQFYECGRCGGVVTAAAETNGGLVSEMYPIGQIVDISIPNPAASYLSQTMESLHAPAGAVMLAASSVDAMLKAKGYTKGNLYSRIDRAAEDHLITLEMALWAHEIRLDANDQRHADEMAMSPKEEDARRVLEFALALGQFLFVLPSRISRGRKNVTDEAVPVE